MKFEESKFLDLTDTPTTFIYFLLDDDEVVYVGQTTRGLARVYAHIRDKHFTKFYIIEHSIEELDYWEDYYIFKYHPKYNKRPNFSCNFSMQRVVHKINEMYTTSIFQYKMTKPKLKKILKELNIKPREYDNELYIGIDDFCEIVNCIEDYKKGAPLNEVFNIGN